ncbi:MAG: tyrosine-type recombinase/integrase [Aggregatilineales bacterium]
MAPSTFNQRLAILGSFYEYCIKQELLTANPIRRVDRRTVHQYSSATALDTDDVKHKLEQIDRTTLVGQRDYALLLVALKTGRRLSELAGLRSTDLLLIGHQVTLTFRHAKGGKVMADKLTAQTSKALLDYLDTAYRHDLGELPSDAPVWVSVSNRTRGQALSIQAIADVCQARLGISKVHTLRHTFAHTMEKAGAAVSEIQARLGHESLQTTGRYLASLRRVENAHADKLDELFGV